MTQGSPWKGCTIPTPVTPEEAFQAIGRLRKAARDEIDRLIRFLDKTDDYVSRELEHEDGNDEPEGDEEPSLGSFDRMTDQEKAWRQRGEFLSGGDSEQDDADREDCDPAEDSDGLVSVKS